MQNADYPLLGQLH